MKKVFFISAIVLGITLLLAGVYNFAFRNNVNNPSVKDTSTVEVKNQPTTAPEVKEDPIKVLTDEKAMNPSYDVQNNSVRYFSPQKREIKNVSLDTQDVTMVMSLSGEPSHAVWSPRKNQALAELKTGQETRWYLIDTDTKTETPLKNGIETPIWTQLGDRIVYKYYDTKTKGRTLNTANPDGSDWKEIGESPFKNMSATIMPQGGLFVFWNQGNAFEETSLRSVSLVGGDVKTMFSGKFGADYVFSPDGQKILMSSTNKKGGTLPMLGLLLNQGAQYQNLLIPTLVTKTVWAKSGKTVYYALPGALPENAIIPDDYFSRAILTQDTFWKVNLETGEKKRIVETKDITTSYDASSMILSDDETMLIFINRVDGKLYSIRL